MEDRHESVRKREKRRREEEEGTNRARPWEKEGSLLYPPTPATGAEFLSVPICPIEQPPLSYYPGSPRPKPSHPSEQGNGGVKEEDKRRCEGRGSLSHISTRINPTNEKKRTPQERKKPHHDFLALPRMGRVLTPLSIIRAE